MERSQAPLRFGIMCNGSTLRAFQLSAINRLIETGTGEPAVLIVDDRPQPVESGRGRFLRRLTAPKLLWRLYRGFSEPPVSRDVPMGPDLAQLPQIRCRPLLKGRFAEYFSDDDVARVASYDLDFILRFGFGIIKGDILQSARYGVWSFHHGDERRYRGGPPAFWEMFEGNALTGAVLQRLTDRLDAGIILRRGLIKTINYSYRHNYGLLLKETIHWPAAAAREILGGVAPAADSSTTDARIYVAPTNWEMLRYLPRLLKNIVGRLYERELREEWNIGAVQLSPEQVVRGAVASDVVWHPGVSGGWFADPCARQDGTAIDVLCERMRLDSGKAYIAAVPFDGEKWGKDNLVIDKGCHASYPYVFSDNGEIYCVPETQESNDVVLYRARAFPNEWEHAATLLRDINVVDSTLFKYEGRWWLLCTDEEGSGHRLMAFFADTLFGPWEPHPKNPVKTDPRSSRPAGPLFWLDGTLYRPAQDCSKTYGGRISICKIVELSPSSFDETPVAHLEPDRRERYGKGLHTVSFAGEWAIIDGKRWRWKKSRT